MKLKKIAGATLATSPISMLLIGITYAEGWKAGLFVAGGTVVLMAIVFSGILLLAD